MPTPKRPRSHEAPPVPSRYEPDEPETIKRGRAAASLVIEAPAVSVESSSNILRDSQGRAVRTKRASDVVRTHGKRNYGRS